MHAKKDLNPKFTFSNRGPKSPPVIYGTALFLPPVFVSVGTHDRKTKRKAAGSHGLQGPCLHRSSRARRRPGSCGGAKGARAPAPGDWAAASDNQEGSPCARRLLRRPAAATAGPEAPAPLGLQRQPAAGRARSPVAAAPAGGGPDPRASPLPVSGAQGRELPLAEAEAAAVAASASEPSKAASSLTPSKAATRSGELGRGERDSHFCVPTRLRRKLRLWFWYSVGASFFHRKQRARPIFGFRCRDGYPVGDSLKSVKYSTIHKRMQRY
jgi:hypothetical protein